MDLGKINSYSTPPPPIPPKNVFPRCEGLNWRVSEGKTDGSTSPRIGSMVSKTLVRHGDGFQTKRRPGHQKADDFGG